MPAVELRLHQEIAGTEAAGPPRVFGENLIFTFEFDQPVTLAGNDTSPARRRHLVQIAFEHEDYATLHPFVVNDEGVYLYTIPVPRDRDELRYRLVVNGLWTADPFNPATELSALGARVSVVRLPPPPPPTTSPLMLDQGQVEFRYSGRPNRSITVVGDFNGWDPYMHRLKEVEPGEYALRISLLPGDHVYYYVVDGVRLRDPLNPRTSVIRDRVFASAVTVP